MASVSLVCTNRVAPEDRNTEPLEEYDDEYQYDDAEDSSHFSAFGQKNSKIKPSTVNYISNHVCTIVHKHITIYNFIIIYKLIQLRKYEHFDQAQLN